MLALLYNTSIKVNLDTLKCNKANPHDAFKKDQAEGATADGYTDHEYTHMLHLLQEAAGVVGTSSNNKTLHDMLLISV